MESNSKIQKRLKVSYEFSSEITVDNVTYLVHTEEIGEKQSKAFSMVYLNGEILFSKDADYSHLVGREDFPGRFRDFMKRLHRSVIEKFTSELIKKQKKRSEYFDEAKSFLRDGKSAEALTALQEGLKRFPSDPFLLSYYGCLCSVVAKKPKEGIKICTGAISKLKGYVPLGSEFFYPLFYLNLGRAYLGANKKKEAIRAFNIGLKADPEDQDLIGEFRKLGIRRKPPVSFLKRSNPFNRYIGLLLGKASRH